MSIRFAAPASPHNPLRCLRFVEVECPADNDNASALHQPDLLPAALRYFAKHGLAAAAEARREAEAAASRGDEDGFALWRDICGTLDRRMARDLDVARAQMG